MQPKKKLSPAQLAQRRANALAASLRPSKPFVTVKMEEPAKKLIKDFIADPANEVKTISQAVIKRFS